MYEILEQLQDELNAYNDDSVIDNRSRMIVHDGCYIYLYLKNSGTLETMNYSPELYHFLARPSCCSYSYDYKKERVQIELMAYKKAGKRYKPTLGGFMQRWYKNNLPLDKFLEGLPKETAKHSVDHANNDRHNHCKWNLSDVGGSNNSKKGVLSFNIKPPYFCYIAVTESEEYRVAFGYENTRKQGFTQYFLCKDIGNLITLLRAIMQIKKPPAWIRKYGTPWELWKADPKAICANESFRSATGNAERLLSMDESEFTIWTGVQA